MIANRNGFYKGAFKVRVGFLDERCREFYCWCQCKSCLAELIGRSSGVGSAVLCRLDKGVGDEIDDEFLAFFYELVGMSFRGN